MCTEVASLFLKASFATRNVVSRKLSRLLKFVKLLNVNVRRKEIEIVPKRFKDVQRFSKILQCILNDANFRDYSSLLSF